MLRLLKIVYYLLQQYYTTNTIWASLCRPLQYAFIKTCLLIPFIIFYSNITQQTQYEHPCAAHYNMLGGGQQGGQLGSSPGLQSVLQTALQGLQAPAANAGGLPAGAGGLASAGLQQPSVISMLTPGGVALPLALASGSVQQQVTTASATSALPNMVHTQFNPPHVLVPANPYLHEGSYILLFYSKLLFTSWFHEKTENRIQNFHEFLN